MKFFQQPYPYYYFRTNLFRLAATAFVIIFVFLLAFKPFIVNPAEQRVSYWLICAIHAFVPAMVFSIYFFVADGLLSETAKDRWSLGTEIAHLCILFFLFGIGSFLVRDIIYTNPDNWSWYYLTEEVKNTFLGGTLISLLLILLNFYRLYSHAQQDAIKISKQLHPSISNAVHAISITTNVKSDDFELDLASFLFARASGNYVEVYSKAGMRVTKQLKRLTLAQLEAQLSSHVLRTHRSFLVNPDHIVHVSGNAQGYELSFSGTDLKAPVSRGSITAFNAAMA
jgi:hypothetical protein